MDQPGGKTGVEVQVFFDVLNCLMKKNLFRKDTEPPIKVGLPLKLVNFPVQYDPRFSTFACTYHVTTHKQQKVKLVNVAKELYYCNNLRKMAGVVNGERVKGRGRNGSVSVKAYCGKLF